MIKKQNIVGIHKTGENLVFVFLGNGGGGGNNPDDPSKKFLKVSDMGPTFCRKHKMEFW